MSNDNTGDPAATPYTGPDHGFGDDNAIAAEIISRDWYDDAPSPHDTTRMGTRDIPMPTTVDALSPEMAAPILKQLAGLPPERREQREAELVAAALRDAARDARILTGAGSHATPFVKAQVNIAYRERELERRIADWNSQLDEVVGARLATDPTTGEAKPTPVHRLTGEARDIAKGQVAELTRQLSVLKGPGGDRELKEAMLETIALENELREQREDLVEADRRFKFNVREERINRRAELMAKNHRTSF